MSTSEELLQALPPVLRKMRASVEASKSESATAAAAAVSAAVVTLELGLTPTTINAAGAAVIDPDVAYVQLAHASQITATIAAPAAGQFMLIVQTGTGTAGHTVTLTAGTFNVAGNNTATFNAIGEALLIFGLSATLAIVVANVGTVGMSTV
jgi:hypothetical protein